LIMTGAKVVKKRSDALLSTMSLKSGLTFMAFASPEETAA
jgi:hypothetical protein